MKRLLIATIVSLLVTGFTSCDKQKPTERPTGIVGEWQLINSYTVWEETEELDGDVRDITYDPSDHWEQWIFKDGGILTTVYYDQFYDDGTRSSDDRWELSGNTLKLIDPDMAERFGEEAATIEYTVAECNADRLVLTNAGIQVVEWDGVNDSGQYYQNCFSRLTFSRMEVHYQ